MSHTTRVEIDGRPIELISYQEYPLSDPPKPGMRYDIFIPRKNLATIAVVHTINTERQRIYFMEQDSEKILHFRFDQNVFFAPTPDNYPVKPRN